VGAPVAAIKQRTESAVSYTVDAAHKTGVTERTYAAQPRRRMEIACAITVQDFSGS
jgi:hypothetical protein